MKKNAGTFYGVGVGPGDPSMLTLRAADVLRGADVVFCAAARNSRKSVSRSVVESLGHRQGELVELVFSMHRDKAVCQKAWRENAVRVVDELKKGRDCAFATIGDPLIYSTYSYLLAEVQQLLPEVTVETVPGITSFQLAAARGNKELVEDDDILTVIPADHLAASGKDDLLSATDCVVILKTYKQRNRVLERFRSYGVKPKGIYAAHLGMEGEIITDDLDNVPERPNEYLSMLILKTGNADGICS